MNLSELQGHIWFNGELVPWQKAQVHVLTHTLHYGLGVFEGVRAYETKKGTAIFRLEDHTERLFKSAGVVNLDIPYSFSDLNLAQMDVVKVNNLSESYIRPMCFYGPEGLGLRADNLKVNTIIAAWEWPSYMDPEAQEKGIKVKVSNFKRQINNPVASAKINGNYVTSIVALESVMKEGFDEALMLDTNNFIAEGSGENFFMVQGGKLFTPLLDACLDGITRRTVIDLAKELSIEIVERNIKLEEVFDSDEAFLTGTAAEVVPIRSLNNKPIGNGLRGPVTELLQKTYFEQVRGKRTVNAKWHTFLN